MSIAPAELLRRLSASLRADIGPAVGDEYARTQAFMASVILERVSRQLEFGPAHQAAETADLTRLCTLLTPTLLDGPPEVVSAFAEVRSQATVASLGGLIAALYAWGVDEPTVTEALGHIRPVLRHDIDRRMRVAE